MVAGENPVYAISIRRAFVFEAESLRLPSGCGGAGGFWFPAPMAVIANDDPVAELAASRFGASPDGRLSIAPLAWAGDPIGNS